MDKLFHIKNHLHDFYIWWTTGLLLLLPASVRRAIDLNKETLTVEFKDQHLFLQSNSGDPADTTDECSTPLADELQKAICLQWLRKKLTDQTRVQLLIPDNKVLHKQLTLPKATENNLRQVLEFEMDRRTPFTADQVYFDYSISGKAANNAHLLVELYVVQKDYVEQLLETLKTFNLTPHSVNSTGATTNNTKLNLLPADKRIQQKNNTIRPVLSLAALAFFLLLAVLYVPIIKQYQNLDVLEQEIKTHHKLAMQANTLKEQRDRLLFNSQFMAEKQKNYLPVIELMNELTGILPDHTWISRFTLANGEVQVQGESEAASSIIELMESSKHFNNTRFISPVTRNEQTRKDKFNISAKITGVTNEIARTE